MKNIILGKTQDLTPLFFAACFAVVQSMETKIKYRNRLTIK